MPKHILFDKNFIFVGKSIDQEKDRGKEKKGRKMGIAKGVMKVLTDCRLAGGYEDPIERTKAKKSPGGRTE